jgi:hypothetical protein
LLSPQSLFKKKSAWLGNPKFLPEKPDHWDDFAKVNNSWALYPSRQLGVSSKQSPGGKSRLRPGWRRKKTAIGLPLVFSHPLEASARSVNALAFVNFT